MAAPLLEFSEAPRLQSGDDVLGFVAGERLGADEPCALENKKKD
jgi:hypothetical protein